MIKFGIPHITKDEINATNKILKSKWLTTGQIVVDFENNFKRYKKSKYKLEFPHARMLFLCLYYH